MTKEEIIEMVRWSGLGMLLEVGGMDKCLEHFAKLVAEKAIKEALAHPEQEPVAWMFQHDETGRTMCIDAQQLGWGFEKGNPRLKKIAPLYTTTPQRTWIELTDNEIAELSDKILCYQIYDNKESGVFEFARAILRKAQIKVGCAECGVNGNHALYCVKCAEKYLKEKNT